MPSLAPIPTTSSSKLPPDTSPSNMQSFVEYPRARPRSRVLLLSRSHVRVRKRLFQPVSSLKGSLHGPARQQSAGEGGSPEYWENRAHDGELSQTPLLKPTVSDVSEASGYIREPSESSFDLDAFPLLPVNRKVLGVPSHDDRLQSSQTDGALKENRAGQFVPQSGQSISQVTQSRPGVYPHHQVTEVVDGSSQNDVQSQSQKRRSIDPVLVDAIAKTVVEQLRLYSAAGTQAGSARSTPSSSSICKDSSRTPSQRQALDRFVKELQRYADNVNAAGRLPLSTPTRSKSPATLHTVSALLPYRQEFRSAGLAVTSRDQAQRDLRAAIQGSGRREYRKTIQPPTFPDVGGMDGKQETASLPSTEVDFVDPETVDVWRRALIERLPSRRQAAVIETDGSSAAGCLPCRSSKQPLRGKDKPKASAETTKRNQEAQDFADSGQSKVQATMPQPRKMQGLRPKGYTLPQTDHHPATTHNHQVQGKVVTRNDLRTTKNKQLYPKPSIGLDPVLGRTQDSYAGPVEGEARDIPRAPKSDSSESSPPSSPPPQHPIRLDSQMFRQRPYQSLPLNQTRVSPTEEHLAYSPPRAPSVPQTKRSPKRRLRHTKAVPKEKSAMQQEIADHDHGPWRYPAHNPKPRSRVGALPRRRPRIPSRKSSLRQIRPVSNASILDFDVLKGLCIATTAACDKATDDFLHEKTGVHIRRFLAELIQYESLTQRQPGDSAEEYRRRSRSQMRQLKYQVRKSRELGQAKTYQH
jgi:hypothetical protein